MFLACPDCSLITTGGIIEVQTIVSKEAFSNSTLFMLCTMFIVLGFMVYIFAKTIKAFTK
jgi:hypothetical protein